MLGDNKKNPHLNFHYKIKYTSKERLVWSTNIHSTLLKATVLVLVVVCCMLLLLLLYGVVVVYVVLVVLIIFCLDMVNKSSPKTA